MVTSLAWRAVEFEKQPKILTGKSRDPGDKGYPLLAERICARALPYLFLTSGEPGIVAGTSSSYLSWTLFWLLVERRRNNKRRGGRFTPTSPFASGN
jgi:hypothetical protein